MKANYIDRNDLQKDRTIEKIATALRNGKLVVFPTETVYGIGANGLDSNACERIYVAKGRASDNPLILHISDKFMLEKIARNISSIEQKLIDAFFPGPFTLILPKTNLVPSIVTAGLDTVAVRMPSHPIAHRIIASAGIPIAAPSANISGKPSGTTIKDIEKELEDRVEYIVDGGDSIIGLESTVVRVIDSVPTILRPGKITKEQILEVAGKVALDKHLFEDCTQEETVLSPGMKHKHYAPNTKCVLFYSQDNARLVNEINQSTKDPEKTLVICTKENRANYHAQYVLEVGSKENLEEISHHIFSTLRKIDTYPVDIVLIEGVTKDGLGLAIMNRLIRACAYQYIEC